MAGRKKRRRKFVSYEDARERPSAAELKSELSRVKRESIVGALSGRDLPSPAAKGFGGQMAHQHPDPSLRPSSAAGRKKPRRLRKKKDLAPKGGSDVPVDWVDQLKRSRRSGVSANQGFFDLIRGITDESVRSGKGVSGNRAYIHRKAAEGVAEEPFDYSKFGKKRKRK